MANTTKFSKVTGKITFGFFITAVVGLSTYELLRSTSLREGHFRNWVFVCSLYCVMLCILSLAIFLISLMINKIQQKGIKTE